eukprot:360078-Chlamydomonas_euryale.AAC.11
MRTQLVRHAAVHAAGHAAAHAAFFPAGGSFYDSAQQLKLGNRLLSWQWMTVVMPCLLVPY